MNDFLRIPFDPARCQEELKAFGQLLAAQKELEENADIKPFFEAHPQLALCAGCYAWSITRTDLLAFQYQLFGDYSCDLVVGDSVQKAYVFVEWEDATAGSLFRQQGKKATPEWSARVERGFSQVLDWFQKLNDMERTDEFEARFGARHVQYTGLLVVGRDADLAHPRERRRWEWRAQKVFVNGLPILCVTYDQLHRFLANKLNVSFAQPTQAG